MISNLDIHRAANLLIRQYGGDAEIEAARKADLMLERGDPDGQLVCCGSSGRSSYCGRRRSGRRTDAKAEVEAAV